VRSFLSGYAKDYRKTGPVAISTLNLLLWAEVVFEGQRLFMSGLHAITTSAAAMTVRTAFVNVPAFMGRRVTPGHELWRGGEAAALPGTPVAGTGSTKRPARPLARSAP